MPLGYAIHLWRNNPRLLWYLILLAIGIGAWHHACTKEVSDGCGFWAREWQAQVADQRKFLRMNRPDPKEAMSEWKSRVARVSRNDDEKLLEIRNAGRAAHEFRQCRDPSDSDLKFLHMPTTDPTDEQISCFEHYTEGRIGFGVREAVKPGCNDVLADSVEWITQNFPDT